MKKNLAKYSGLMALAILFVPFALHADVDDIKTPAPINPKTEPCIVVSSDIGIGATDSQTGNQISLIQNYLAAKGHLKKSDITGYFGPNTQAALKQFQTKNGVDAVGTIGPKTRKLMGQDCAPAPQTNTKVPLAPTTIGITYPKTSFLSEIGNLLSSVNLLAQVVESTGLTSQSVTSLTLVNADTGQDIATLVSGTTIDLGKLPTKNLNIRADTNPAKVTTGVRFGYDSSSNYKTESIAPYDIGGDNNSGIPFKYNAWTPAVGTHKISATPYNKSKVSGTGITITLIVINSGIADTVAPTVSISSPVNGASVTGGSNTTVTATASDNVGVTKVEFYKSGVLYATDIASPFSFIWAVPAAISTSQSFSFTAKAYDAAGNSSMSPAVTYLVPATVPPPTVGAPANITYTAAPYNVTFRWTNVATGLVSTTLHRSSDGVTYALIAQTGNSIANTIGDGTAAPGGRYWYELGAYLGGTTEILSAPIIITVPTTAPPATTTPTATISASLASIVSGSSSVITWSSTNATACTASGAWTGPLAVSGTQSVSPTITSTYGISCTGAGGTSAVSSVTVTVSAVVDTSAPTVTITSPTNGATVLGSLTVTASSSDNVGVTGVILKVDGAALGTVTTANASFTVNTFSLANGTHTLVATAVDAAGNVGTSATITITVNNTVVNTPVTVSVNNMISFNELYVDGSASDDTIKISQSGSTVTVSANGATQAFTGPFGDIVVKGEAGNDSITVDSSVTTPALLYGGTGNNTLVAQGSAKITMVTIGGGTDTLTGNGNTYYWVGTEDVTHPTSAETSAGRVHVVSAFAVIGTYNGSTALNSPTIPSPTDPTWDVVYTTGHSLWGAGPVMEDVNQQGLSDCYSLAGLAGMAYTDPNSLQNLAVDLGDGTYAVQYLRNGVKTFVRVDANLDFLEAKLGPSGNLWNKVFEKSYAYFRSGLNTYASLNFGSASGYMRDLGLNATAVSISSLSDASLYNTITTQLAAHKTFVSNTISSGAPNLVSSHSYTTLGATKDSSGNINIINLRNPWGWDGSPAPTPADSNVNDALVSTPIAQYRASVSSVSYQQ